MPQPKKTSSRTSAKPRASAAKAAKPAAKKAPAKKKPAAAAKPAATVKPRAAAKPTAAAKKPRAAAAKPAAAKPAASPLEPLGLAALRDSLARGIVLTRDLLSETLDDAVKRGRMTREDAEDLTATLVGIGRRQTQDLIADVEQLLGRGRSRASVSTDKIVRKVDKARRAAGIGPAFPILGYDDLNAKQIAERVTDLTPAELRKVRDHERRNASRKSVLAAIERALG